MRYEDIPGDFLNRLQFILNMKLPNVDRNIIDDIKSEADDALQEILEKYNLIS